MPHRIVSAEKALKARKALLVLEQDMAALQNKVAHTRKYLPWVRVNTLYLFESGRGTQTLADLFQTRSQLIVFHFRFQPFDVQGGVISSLEADNFADIVVHLNFRDIAFVLVSDASVEKINDYQKRMQWHFDWVSTDGGRFNQDYLQAHNNDSIENSGISVFSKDSEGYVYHTYSCQGEIMQLFNTAHHLMDITPNGRGLLEEKALLKRHDNYDYVNPLAQIKYKVF